MLERQAGFKKFEFVSPHIYKYLKYFVNFIGRTGISLFFRFVKW